MNSESGNLGWLTLLPAALADSLVRRAGPLRAHERPTVQRNTCRINTNLQCLGGQRSRRLPTDDELLRGDALRGVPLDGAIRRDGVGRPIVVQGRLVAGGRVPRASVVVRHQVPEREVLVHLAHFEHLVV